jgi:hypothetical protein
MANALLDEYAVVLRGRGSSVTAAIPSLGVTATASSPDAAVQALEGKVAALVREFTDLGLADQLNHARRSGDAGLRRFAYKAGITAAACAAVVILAISSLSMAISYQVNRLVAVAEGVVASTDPNHVAKAIFTQVDKIAERARTMNPDIRDHFVANVRVLVQQAKPISDELQPLFCQPEAIPPAVPHNVR